VNLAALTEQIAAVCPIHGVNSERVISFKSEATPEQRAQAQAIADAAVLDNDPGIPQEVTRRQALQALLLAEKLDLVQPAIDAITDATQRALMQIEWDASQVFQRHRPAVIQIGGAIGLDAAGIDNLFVEASQL
jgi:hypothetical protein